MKCAICGIAIDSIEKMLEQDWIASFFDGEDEHGPLCPSCTDTLLYIAPNGEFELKEEYRGKIGHYLRESGFLKIFYGKSIYYFSLIFDLSKT